MSIKIGRKGARYTDLSTRTGMTINNGPFVGVVKNNLDPTRAGRLQVYIPELGGINPDDPRSWFTVTYASPFRGQTVPEGKWTYETAQLAEDENGMQSYGMWFTPPDVGVKVLCLFANGDPSQGYYIGTIMDSFDSHMIPAIGASFKDYEWNPGTGNGQYPKQLELVPYITNPDGEIPYRLPVTEAPYETQSSEQFATLKRAPHVYQTKRLGIQGLAFDFIRGSTSASSTRESPSQVFGISTPGRLYPFKDKQTSQETLDLISKDLDSNTTSPEVDKRMKNINRIGGHSIVMDDGTVQGNDAGIRIRTSNGNMILLDDTNEQIYIVNAKGTAWIEMSPSGRIDIYSLNDFSIRSQGNINLQADNDINMHAGGRINQYAANSIRLESQGKIALNSATQVNVWGEQTVAVGSKGQLILSSEGQASMKSGADVVLRGSTIQLNSNDGAPDATKPEVMEQYTHNHVELWVKKQGEPGVWWAKRAFKSIAKIAPAHEPWPGHEIPGIKARQVPRKPVAEPVPQETNATTESNPGDIAAQPTPGDSVCGLTQGEFKSLLTTLGKKESGGKFPKSGPGVLNQTITSQYNTYNKYGYVGKYQFGAAALEECGYIKKGTYAKTSGSTGAEGMDNRNWKILMNPNNWARSDIGSVQAWLANGAEQEKAMEDWMKIKCKELSGLGVITSNTSHADIGGYLMVAHLNGSRKALELMQNPNAPTSGPNASIQSYFAAGRAAIKQAGDTGFA